MKNTCKKLISASLSCAFLALCLTGCSKNASVTDNSPSGVPETQISDPGPGKVLTIVTAKELDNLTTLTMNKENNIACGLVYETLVSYENGNIIPALAEDWSWDKSSTVLTFRLRQGITFTDGTAFHADSVKAILEFDRSNPNFSGIKGIHNIQKVETVDEYTVAVYYDAPCFSYLNDFCFQNVAGMMSPNVFEAENFQTFKDVAGTGPYVRKEMVSGDCTRFVRNENYWGEAPYYDEVVVKYIPEASSRLQALQTGEVDLIYGADLITYDDYNQGVTLKGIAGEINEGNTLTRNLVLNAAGSMLNDRKVREAVAYAVNKQEITQGLTYGYETPAAALFSQNAPYTDIAYHTVRECDLDKANALLNEAGWIMNKNTGFREKAGKPLTLNYTYWTDLSLAKEMALAIKAQLAKAGIHVETTGQDQMTWWTEGVAGNYDITTWNTEGSYTEPHKYLQESLGADPHAVSLQALDEFEEYSAAVKLFSTTADPEVVKEAIAAALHISNDNGIDLPISYSKDLVLYNSAKVAGYTFSSVPQFFDINNVQPVR
ncbi:nickel ABC transporter substrate-binding protein [Lacrimispora sp.]|uniref:nickel ABC transporter substrate-binding protein n=1 Tax=Lacrimispora sp. TaxID=2719234 RepID=UPI0028A77EB4|nr:nickel ABC transporter substrate-binding protein [Lacrimispora sp.]